MDSKGITSFVIVSLNLLFVTTFVSGAIPPPPKISPSTAPPRFTTRPPTISPSTPQPSISNPPPKISPSTFPQAPTTLPPTISPSTPSPSISTPSPTISPSTFPQAPTTLPPTTPTSIPPSIPATPPPPPQLYPPPPSYCQIGLGNFHVCANLSDIVNVIIGPPQTTRCCQLINGLVGLEASVCLCAALKANIFGVIDIDLDIPLGIFFNRCGRVKPTDYICRR